MTKVLLTGGNGFIAAHILNKLLERGHTVITTVRSESKAEAVRQAHGEAGDKLSVEVVEDITVEGAFEGVLNGRGVEVVLHTASPFHFRWTDPKTEVVDPAVKGTTSILRTIKSHAPTVTHVVVTSSFASIIDPSTIGPSTTFTEASWNPVVLADIYADKSTAYRASKKLAEEAAWEFVRSEKPGFTLSTVCPPLVFGPVAQGPGSLDEVNTSNERVVDLLRGKWREGIPDPGPAVIWVDVRDVAEAHIRAFEREAARGKRLFTSAGYFDNREIVDVLRGQVGNLEERLPGNEAKGGARSGEIYKVDNSATNEALGIEWIGLQESIVDFYKSVKGLGF